MAFTNVCVVASLYICAWNFCWLCQAGGLPSDVPHLVTIYRDSVKLQFQTTFAVADELYDTDWSMSLDSSSMVEWKGDIPIISGVVLESVHGGISETVKVHLFSSERGRFQQIRGSISFDVSVTAGMRVKFFSIPFSFSLDASQSVTEEQAKHLYKGFVYRSTFTTTHFSGLKAGVGVKSSCFASVAFGVKSSQTVDTGIFLETISTTDARVVEVKIAGYSLVNSKTVLSQQSATSLTPTGRAGVGGAVTSCVKSAIKNHKLLKELDIGNFVKTVVKDTVMGGSFGVVMGLAGQIVPGTQYLNILLEGGSIYDKCNNNAGTHTKCDKQIVKGGLSVAGSMAIGYGAAVLAGPIGWLGAAAVSGVAYAVQDSYLPNVAARLACGKRCGNNVCDGHLDNEDCEYDCGDCVPEAKFVEHLVGG